MDCKKFLPLLVLLLLYCSLPLESLSLAQCTAGCGSDGSSPLPGQLVMLHISEAAPDGGVVRDASGNLYGMVDKTLFKLGPDGTYSVLYTFLDPLLYEPRLLLGSGGNIFGVQPYGGKCLSDDRGCGQVFKLDSAGNLTTLYSFSGGADGAYPRGRLSWGQDGSLFGTAGFGGSGSCYLGCGVIFKLDADGKETVVHSFNGTSDGYNPHDGVIQDRAGNLYGTNGGSIFKLNVSDGSFVRYSSPSWLNSIEGPLTLDAQANVYGAAGPAVFKLDPAGNFTLLHSFENPGDGAGVESGLAIDSFGNLYGVSDGGFFPDACHYSYGCGVIFKLDAAGNETVLYRFLGGTDEYSRREVEPPTLVLDPSGNLYGTTSSGVFMLSHATSTLPQTLPPVFSTPVGDTGAQTVTLSDPDPNATIYYSIDRDHGPNSAYDGGPITLPPYTETLEAFAVSDGNFPSAVVSSTYKVLLATPVVTVARPRCEHSWATYGCVPYWYPSSPIGTAEAFFVSMTVRAGFNPAPTGTIILASGPYISPPIPLVPGQGSQDSVVSTASAEIPTGSVKIGPVLLTATYTPDAASSALYSSATASLSITMVKSEYSMTATDVALARGSSNYSTIVVSSTAGYLGTISLTCAVTSSPAGALALPTCSPYDPVRIGSYSRSGTTVVAVSTTAAKAALDSRPGINGIRRAQTIGTVLACLVFCVSRRKRWNSISSFMAMFIIGVLIVSGCAGDKTQAFSSNAGTTPGRYTMTLSGIGDDAAKTTASTSFTVTVF
jgi:uncharacterized repeat protein (TIGR03803 family)